jgi:hypothetical protein
VRVESNHSRAAFSEKLPDLFKLKQGNTKLGVGAGSLDVLVMTTTMAGVNAQEQFPPAKQVAPVPKRMKVVERNPHTLSEAVLVVGSRCKVRGVKNALRVDARKQVQDAANLVR